MMIWSLRRCRAGEEGSGAEAPADTGVFTYYIPRPDERAPRVFKYMRPPYYALLGLKCGVNMTTSVDCTFVLVHLELQQ